MGRTYCKWCDGVGCNCGEIEMNVENRREQLIRQMRTALGELQSPTFFEHNETIVFDIADVGYEFTEEDLETQVDWY